MPSESSEREPLLSASRPQQTQRTESSLSQFAHRRSLRSIYSSPALYVLPLVFLGQLSVQLPATTTIEIVLQVICRLYWNSHGGQGGEGGGDGGGPPFEADCHHPRVFQIFSTVIAVNTLMITIGTFIMFGILSRLSSKYGRKPVIVTMSSFLTVVNTILLVALKAPDQVQDVLLLVWVVLSIFCVDTNIMVLLADMYISDIAPPEERTSILSLSFGLSVAGSIPAFALGGLISQKSGNYIIVYAISTVLSLLMVIYSLFILPESLSSEKRAAIRRDIQAEDDDSILGEDTNAGRGKKVLNEVMKPLHVVYMTVLHPLSLFVPKRRKEGSGKMNWRLFCCGMYAFVSQLGTGYILNGLIVYLTTLGGYKPDDNGFVLTAVASAGAFTLTIATPLFIKLVRPDNKDNQTQARDQNKSSLLTGTKLEVYIAIFGWILEITAILLIPYHAGKRSSVTLLFILYGIGVCRQPAIRSILVASVEPTRSGEALSAAQMAGSMGSALSTFILGSILSSTVSTKPQAMFWTFAGIECVTICILLCIRDEDRYFPKAGDGEGEEDRED